MTPDSIQGRLVALEVMVQRFFVEWALNHDDPVAQLGEWRDGAIASLEAYQSANTLAQTMISEAAEAVEANFEQAEVQLRQFLQE
jgi:hypothetical protein